MSKFIFLLRTFLCHGEKFNYREVHAMLFLLSCLLKSCLSFLTLAALFSDYKADSILVVFISAQIITLDYFIFLNNEIPYFDFSFFKDLNLFTFKRKFAAISSACLMIGSMCFFVSPLYSGENICIPELKDLKQYTADTNFMSFEGYIVSHFKIRYGKDISRGEARKIVKEYFKKKSKFQTVDNSQVISGVNAVKADINPALIEKWRNNEDKCRNILASLKNMESGGAQALKTQKTAPALEVKETAKPKTDCPGKDIKIKTVHTGIAVDKTRPEKLEKTQTPPEPIEITGGEGSFFNSKRVVLLPFKAAAGGFEALDTVSYFTAKYLKEKGYEVISGADISGVCFNLDDLDNSKISEIAQKFDANFIITGEILKYKKSQTTINRAFLETQNMIEIEIKTKIHNASIEKCFSDSEKTKCKSQAFEAFDGTQEAIFFAVKALVYKLYSKFEL